jgi:uncharacterized protein
MKTTEQAIQFQCGSDRLIGIMSAPEFPGACGVLIIVGGPQYRAGSHRQFTLLARYLAARGIPAMRFDQRGVGDSEGEPRSFENIDEDVRSAVDAFTTRIPGLNQIVIWGLCDAASAALFYAPSDSRIAGVILLNPWVRTPQAKAKTYLRHYYLRRLIDPALWRKIWQRSFDYGAALRSLSAFLGVALRRLPRPAAQDTASDGAPRVLSHNDAAMPFPERMAESVSRFNGKVLIILSVDDFTAQEFQDTVKRSRKWRRALRTRSVTYRHLPAANHTFSRQEWREQVAEWTALWIAERQSDGISCRDSFNPAAEQV